VVEQEERCGEVDRLHSGVCVGVELGQRLRPVDPRVAHEHVGAGEAMLAHRVRPLLRDLGGGGLALGEIGLDQHYCRAKCPNAFGRRLRGGPVVAVVKADERDAIPAEGHCSGGADASGCAGDKSRGAGHESSVAIDT
jgi:hypothetical protein